jgi:hypothetical protein
VILVYTEKSRSKVQRAFLAKKGNCLENQWRGEYFTGIKSALHL